jgi:hypothetical protein
LEKKRKKKHVKPKKREKMKKKYAKPKKREK